MDEQQKERLEQELRFLEESLEADVISRDEYERGKERLERKISELEEQPEETPVEETKEPEETKIEEKPTEEPEEQKQDEQEPQIEIKEIKEQPTKIIGAEEQPEQKEETIEPETKPEEQPKEEKPEEKEETIEPLKEEPSEEEEIKVSKKWIYGIIIIILALILFFSIRGCGNSEDTTSTPLEEITPACSSDSDCIQEGAIGICSSPDTPEAACEFKQDIETNLLVINDKNCKSCDSATTKTIVKAIFPNIEINEIDYSTEEAKNLIDQLDIDALPAYIFDPNINEAINFNNFKSALSKREDNYVMTNTASGAIYYFNRPLIENNLDIYMLPETAKQIDPHIEEVSALFNGKLTINKHLVTERQKKALEEEMDINTYPTFLFNNQVKFRGILPANLIKEKICEVNVFEECKEELSTT